MESSVDAKYIVPRDALPDVLWRVTRPEFQITQRVTGELRARNMPDSLVWDDVLEHARKHFDWSYRKPTCFVSVFTNEDHARCWANKLHVYQGGKPICKTQIITALLPDDIHVFDAQKLREAAGSNPLRSQDELLFFGRIPWQCLGRTRPLDETFAPIDACESLGVELLRNANDAFACFLKAVSEDRVQACDEDAWRRLRQAKANLIAGYRRAVDAISRLWVAKLQEVGGDGTDIDGVMTTFDEIGALLERMYRLDHLKEQPLVNAAVCG